MVFTRLAEKLGWTDVVAPRFEKRERKGRIFRKGGNSRNAGRNNNTETSSSSSSSKTKDDTKSDTEASTVDHDDGSNNHHHSGAEEERQQEHAEDETPPFERAEARPESEEDRFARIQNDKLRTQKSLEMEAESRGAFAKKQRVRYHHKGTDTWYDDAVIIGVHYDDGPDKPYYTILFKRCDVRINEEGQEEAAEMEIEKQTTPDRLERVPWNATKTWSIIR